ncbi:MAG: family 10 glycosylhydrolase [Paludibacteraceae bacterium]|nr:family 10 glycosylhydrolase [Paludibacteraceae bacterium]
MAKVMRKYVIIGLLLLAYSVHAESRQPEFRAAWLTTLMNIDWPKTVMDSVSAEAAAVQQAELTELLDQLQAGNINAVCFQARPSADALYRSSYEPWSPVLTGVRGMDPGYDPLAFVIQEAHKRGMELHAWVNPFRYERNAGERILDIEAFIASEDSDPLRIYHPEWLLTYNTNQYKGSIIDPGHPEARMYVMQVLMEIIRNYDIDGLVMDDYFYPYGGTTDEDRRSQRKYKPAGMAVGDWRRACVNEVIRTIHDSIQAAKPWVKFGMSPFGIYSMTDSAAGQFGLQLPTGIVGSDAWADLYCDPLAWVKWRYVDYLAPQLYWSTKSIRQNYETLCRWWSESVASIDRQRGDGRQTHVYISHASYRFDAEELATQIDLNRKYAPHNAPGSIFYNTNQFLNFTGGKAAGNSCAKLSKTRFTDKVLPPVMPWKERKPLTAPAAIEPDTIPVCCDSVQPDSPDSRFRRMTLRQKTEN